MMQGFVHSKELKSARSDGRKEGRKEGADTEKKSIAKNYVKSRSQY